MDFNTYSEQVLQYYADEIPELLRICLSQHPFSTFLDCGCGDGSLLNILSQKNVFSGKSVFALDLSPQRIERIRLLHIRVIATVDNAEEMTTIQENSIDFFVSTNVIEHLDDAKMVDAISRVVKSGGTIYLSSIFKKWYGWYFYRNNGRWVIDPTHVREYQNDHELLDLFDGDRFQLLVNTKTLSWFSVTDFFLKRLGIKNRMFYQNNRAFRFLRKWRIPIPGYYYWELIFKKR